MSDFNGIIEEFPKVSIDNFIGDNLKSTVFFLSHCHWDHMTGLKSLLDNLKYNLYASPLTIHIMRRLFCNIPEDSTSLIGLEIGIKYPINIPGTGQTVFVTLIPAGHCPGSVMFLLEGERRVLYTGDVRMRVNEMKKLKCLYDLTGELKRIDRVYLDTTFFSKRYLKFPTRDESKEEFINLIEPLLETDELIRFEIPAMIGSEYLIVEIAKYFKTKIHVPPLLYNIYKLIPELCHLVTLDGTETQIHVSCNVISWKNYFCDRFDNEKFTIVRQAALSWRDCDYKYGIIEKKSVNNYCVCYSSHCSYDELMGIIRFLKPLDIYPCVFPRSCTEKKEMEKSIKDLVDELNKNRGNDDNNEEKTQDMDGACEVKSEDDIVSLKFDSDDCIAISDESDHDPFEFLDKT